ncbi:MAG: hypothetical protein ABJE66_15980 [Deltaproteobacteria bacterium]
MSVALVSSLVAGCLANDQTDPEATTTSSQDLSTLPTYCIPNDINTCVFPTPWNTSITAVDQYWAGAGTATPAKVMVTFLYPTKADPTTGLATAYYAFLVAGYETCRTTSTTSTCVATNSLAKFYEVPANLLFNFRAAERLARDTQEMANPVLALWDSGVGGPLVGHPGGPVGPGGLPWLLVNTLKAATANVRGAYTNVYNTAVAGGIRTTGTGIAAP